MSHLSHLSQESHGSVQLKSILARINSYLLVLDGKLVGGVVGANHQIRLRMLLGALDQVVVDPLWTNLVRAVVRTRHQLANHLALPIQTRSM